MLKKYPEIENSYRQKFIDNFTNLFPELLDCRYSITEKIHGSNIQLVFEPDKKFKVCSRNRILSDGEEFFGVWEVLDKIGDTISFLQHFINSYPNKRIIRLFGELYGPKIQKGVYYGEERNISFFDMVVDDEFLTQDAFFKFGRKHLNQVVPLFAIANSLEEALNFNTERPSEIVNSLEYPDNICEGIVIKPFDKVFYNKVGQIFYLKKKNEKFKEKSREPKKPKQAEDSNIVRLNTEFRSYITEQRVQNIFSKEGIIQEPKEIGKYIKLILEDAKKDFLKDFSDEMKGMDKKELKKIYNVGSQIANILMKYL